MKLRTVLLSLVSLLLVFGMAACTSTPATTPATTAAGDNETTTTAASETTAAGGWRNHRCRGQRPHEAGLGYQRCFHSL